MLCAAEGLPVDKERDCVLGLWHTIVRLAGCNTRSRTGDDAGGNGLVVENPAAYINMMRREIIAAPGAISVGITLGEMAIPT